MMAAESSKKNPPYSFIQDEQSPAESGRLRPGQCRRLRRLRRMSARRMSARRMPAKMMNQPKSKVKIQGFCFFPQPPRGGYFSPRDENRGFSFSHLHDKGVIFPTYTTRGLFFPKANRRGVSGLQAPKSKVQTPKFVVVGSGRHPAEMKPH